MAATLTSFDQALREMYSTKPFMALIPKTPAKKSTRWEYPDRLGICHNCGAPLETDACWYCGTLDLRMRAKLATPKPAPPVDDGFAWSAAERLQRMAIRCPHEIGSVTASPRVFADLFFELGPGAVRVASGLQVCLQGQPVAVTVARNQTEPFILRPTGRTA